MLPITKKNLAFFNSWERQNRQGFLRFYQRKPLLMADSKKHLPGKPLQPCIIVLLPILKNCYQNKARDFRLSLA